MSTFPQIPEIFTNLPYIETERLLLRPLKLEDADHIFDYAQRPEVMTYSLGYPHQSVMESKKFVESVLQSCRNNYSGLWAIEHMKDKRVIGTCGYELWYVDHFRAEMGYSLSPSYWNNGYMTEALKEIVAFGYENIGLHKIEAMVHPFNLPSIRVLEKLGFHNEARLCEHVYMRDQFVDIDLYVKLSPA